MLELITAKPERLDGADFSRNPVLVKLVARFRRHRLKFRFITLMPCLVLIEGRLCSVHTCTSTFVPGPEARRFYFRFHTTGHLMQMVEFIILASSIKDKFAPFVIPQSEFPKRFLHGNRIAYLCPDNPDPWGRGKKRIIENPSLFENAFDQLRRTAAVETALPSPSPA